MKKKFFTRPVCVMLPVEVYEQIKEITDNAEIGLSDYIREAIQRKLEKEISNKSITFESIGG